MQILKYPKFLRAFLQRLQYELKRKIRCNTKYIMDI